MMEPERIGRGHFLFPAVRGGVYCVDLEATDDCEPGCTCPGFARHQRCWHFWRAMYEETALDLAACRSGHAALARLSEKAVA